MRLQPVGRPKFGVSGARAAFASLCSVAAAAMATAHPIALETGQVVYRLVEVPAGATQMTVRVSANNGDADLYVREGRLPEPGRAVAGQFASTRPDSVESVVINNIRPGRWYIAVLAYRGFWQGDLHYTFQSGSASAPRTVYWSEWGTAVGGSGGRRFDRTPSQNLPEWSPHNDGMGTPSIIRVRWGRYVDGLSLGYRRSNGGVIWGHYRGGNGGQLAEFSLSPGEYVVAIRGRAGDKLDAIQFVTNRGRRSPMYGGGGGRPFELRAPNGFALEDFQGSEGRVIDRLQPFWRSTIPVGSSSSPPRPSLGPKPPTTPPTPAPPPATPPPPPSAADVQISAEARLLYNGRYDIVFTVRNASATRFRWDEFLNFRIDGLAYSNLANLRDPVIEPGESIRLDASIFLDINGNQRRDGADLDGFLSQRGRTLPLQFSTRRLVGGAPVTEHWRGTVTTR